MTWAQCSRSATLQRQMTSLEAARSFSQPGSRLAFQSQQLSCASARAHTMPLPSRTRSQSSVHIYRDANNKRTVCTIVFGDDVTSSASSSESRDRPHFRLPRVLRKRCAFRRQS